MREHAPSLRIIMVWFRFLRRQLHCLGRELILFFWRLWLMKLNGLENLPTDQGAVLFANHASYLDFLLLKPVLGKNSVFVATQKLKKHPLLHWLMRYCSILYIDVENPGFGFFKEVIRQLKSKKHVVIYPEGTRSRSGNMMMPKIGFVKLALKANVPVIPVAIKGTYAVWPPHRQWPRLKRCEIEIGKKIYISPSNAMFRDVFFGLKGDRKFSKLNRGSLQFIACSLMDIVRKMACGRWDDSVSSEISSMLCSRNALNKPILDTETDK